MGQFNHVLLSLYSILEATCKTSTHTYMYTMYITFCNNYPLHSQGTQDGAEIPSSHIKGNEKGEHSLPLCGNTS